MKDSILSKGIYLDFEEFRQNKPSLKLEVNAQETATVVGFKNFKQYYLRIKDSTEIKTKKVWGFCDGKNVYVREGLNFWKFDHMFNQLEYIGRYCTYHGISSNNSPTTGAVGQNGMMMGGGNGISSNSSPTTGAVGQNGMMMGGGSSKVITGKFLNMNNGFSFNISYEYVLLILNKDTELLAEFKATKKKKEHLLDFIKKYSEKHTEELK